MREERPHPRPSCQRPPCGTANEPALEELETAISASVAGSATPPASSSSRSSPGRAWCSAMTPCAAMGRPCPVRGAAPVLAPWRRNCGSPGHRPAGAGRVGAGPGGPASGDQGGPGRRCCGRAAGEEQPGLGAARRRSDRGGRDRSPGTGTGHRDGHRRVSRAPGRPGLCGRARGGQLGLGPRDDRRAVRPGRRRLLPARAERSLRGDSRPRGEPGARRDLDRLEPLPADTDPQLVAVCAWRARGPRSWPGPRCGRGLADQAIADAPNLRLRELALAVRSDLAGRSDAAAATWPTDPPRRVGARRRCGTPLMEAGIAAPHGDPGGAPLPTGAGGMGTARGPLAAGPRAARPASAPSGNGRPGGAGPCHRLTRRRRPARPRRGARRRSPRGPGRPARSRRPSADTAPRTGGGHRTPPTRARRSPAR